MLSTTIASAEDLALLTKILNEHCTAKGIPAGPIRDRSGRILIDLFGSGVDSEAGLRTALEANALFQG